MAIGDNSSLALALAELAASTQGHGNEEIVPQGQRPCPICQKHMQVIDQHGIHIDVCEAHGAWLDQGELATLLERVYRYRRDTEDRPGSKTVQRQNATRRKLTQSINRVAGCLGI